MLEPRRKPRKPPDGRLPLPARVRSAVRRVEDQLGPRPVLTPQKEGVTWIALGAFILLVLWILLAVGTASVYFYARSVDQRMDERTTALERQTETRRAEHYNLKGEIEYTKGRIDSYHEGGRNERSGVQDDHQ